MHFQWGHSRPSDFHELLEDSLYEGNAYQKWLHEQSEVSPANQSVWQKWPINRANEHVVKIILLASEEEGLFAREDEIWNIWYE